MRGLSVLVPGLVAACGGGSAVQDAPCMRPVVFLDRAGGDYDRGVADDVALNKSLVVDAPRTLAPWPYDDASWTSLVGCIRTALAPFPVDITETDPGAAPHYELVFTDTYWAGPAGTTGIVPDSCKPNHRIGFVFGAALPTYTRACQIAMIGFAEMAAGLSLTDNCEDLVDNDMDCAPMRKFIDREVACDGGACRCGGTTENTYQALLAATSCP